MITFCSVGIYGNPITIVLFQFVWHCTTLAHALIYRFSLLLHALIKLRYVCAKMPELRLGVLRGGKVVCGPLIVEVEQGVTCREFLDHLTDGEDGPLSGAERGAWHLIERWYGCGESSLSLYSGMSWSCLHPTLQRGD